MIRRVLVVLALTALLAAPVAAQAKTIKLATLAPKGSPWHEILVDMAAEWEEAAGGDLDVRIYPGGVLGDEPDLMRKMAIGQIDSAMVTIAGLTQLVPDMWVFGMPLIVRDYGELDFLRDRVGPGLKKQFLKKGIVVLNWGEAGWVRFFTNSPVATPEDLQKINLFVWAGDPVLEDAWRKQQFKIVPLPVTDLFSALQSGMVDAYSTTSVASLSFQWFAMAPYMTDMNWAPLVGATIIRSSSWERFPAPVRAKMLAAAEKAGRRFSERTRSFEDDAVKVMQENGLTVVEVSPEALELWQERADVAGKIIEERFVSRALAERARRLLAEYRTRVAQPGKAD